jgi:hypothetical protein
MKNCNESKTISECLQRSLDTTVLQREMKGKEAASLATVSEVMTSSRIGMFVGLSTTVIPRLTSDPANEFFG